MSRNHKQRWIACVLTHDIGKHLRPALLSRSFRLAERQNRAGQKLLLRGLARDVEIQRVEERLAAELGRRRGCFELLGQLGQDL